MSPYTCDFGAMWLQIHTTTKHFKQCAEFALLRNRRLGALTLETMLLCRATGMVFLRQKFLNLSSASAPCAGCFCGRR
jgi:hypothetical protein